MKRANATLTMRNWDGPLPRLGEYCKTPRGRTAFKVIEVRTPTRPAKYRAKFICERTAAASLPEDAVVHEFYWLKRR